MQKTKSLPALVLFSGGLDSILAAKILQQNGFEVIALTYETPFFSAEKGKKAAAVLGIRSIVQDISERHFAIVKQPKYGHGKNMNPCIDCHALMLRIGKEIAKVENCAVIATGEVLGQRPFSQNKHALNLVEQVADLSGKVLRPLSAKLLPATEYETQGIIQREDFLDISGRGRGRQIALAHDWGITDFPAPAGGCKLTQVEFSQRLRQLIIRDPETNFFEANLLNYGRFFPLGQKSFFLIGRDEKENAKLEQLSAEGIYLIKMAKIPGPTALIYLREPDNFSELLPLVTKKIRSHSREARDLAQSLTFVITGAKNENYQG